MADAHQLAGRVGQARLALGQRQRRGASSAAARAARAAAVVVGAAQAADQLDQRLQVREQRADALRLAPPRASQPAAQLVPAQVRPGRQILHQRERFSQPPSQLPLGAEGRGARRSPNTRRVRRRLAGRSTMRSRCQHSVRSTCSASAGTPRASAGSRNCADRARIGASASGRRSRARASGQPPSTSAEPARAHMVEAQALSPQAVTRAGSHSSRGSAALAVEGATAASGVSRRRARPAPAPSAGSVSSTGSAAKPRAAAGASAVRPHASVWRRFASSSAAASDGGSHRRPASAPRAWPVPRQISQRRRRARPVRRSAPAAPPRAAGSSGRRSASSSAADTMRSMPPSLGAADGARQGQLAGVVVASPPSAGIDRSISSCFSKASTARVSQGASGRPAPPRARTTLQRGSCAGCADHRARARGRAVDLRARPSVRRAAQQADELAPAPVRHRDGERLRDAAQSASAASTAGGGAALVARRQRGAAALRWCGSAPASALASAGSASRRRRPRRSRRHRHAHQEAVVEGHAAPPRSAPRWWRRPR